MPSAQATCNAITLRGSTDIVVEFFGYSINSILYQRGIYPPDEFKVVKKYGLNMLVTTNVTLDLYIKNVLTQLSEWLLNKNVQKLVVAVTGAEDKQVLERWQFDLEIDKATDTNTAKERSEKDIHNEIQAIIRQITASVTFLPMLEDKCTFDLLVYTDKDTQVPVTWEESDPKIIKNSQSVKLRSFNTSIHKVNTLVSYKNDE